MERALSLDSPGETLLQVRVRAGYGKQCVIDDVAFALGRGERFGLVGSSGAGKSTLVLALLGLLPWRGGWAEGEVALEGVNLLGLREREARRLRGRRVGFVPQSPMSALNGAVSLRRHFEEAWRAHERGLGERFEARVRDLMEKVRLPGDAAFLKRLPGAVSVGQAQRAVLAMALLHRPPLLIADEPTSALDPVTQVEILDLLRDINNAEGTAVLYISHDLLSVLRFCGRLGVLADGRLVESVRVEELEQGGAHPATQALLRTLPVPVGAVLAYRRRELGVTE